MELRKLRPEDDRSRFRSGDEAIDRFLREQAGQHQFRHGSSATYVLEGSSDLVGFVTVMPSVLYREDLSPQHRRLPRGAVPVLLIARMGVDAGQQRRGLGARLFDHACTLGVALADGYGCVGLVVDAKRDAQPFYERYGFEWLRTSVAAGTARGFLSVATIRAATAP